MAEVPIKLWRDTDEPAMAWRFRQRNGQPAPLADAYRLVVTWPDQVEPFVRTSEAGHLVIDPAAGTVTWPFTRADSVAIPRGEDARYELKGITAGRTRNAAGGRVTVRSWLS